MLIQQTNLTYHLALLGTFLYLCNKLFLLCLQTLPLPLYFPDRFIKHSLIFSQKLCKIQSHTYKIICNPEPVYEANSNFLGY